MPSPVRPADFAATVPGQSSDFCTKFKLVFLELPNLVATYFAWALNSDGAISDDFKAEVNPFSAGDIKITAAPNIPTGWLRAEGQAVSRTTYAALFAALGTIYGTGDTSTTFNLPDYRNKFLLGVSSSKALAATGGEENHTLSIAEMPAHHHSVVIPSDTAPPDNQNTLTFQGNGSASQSFTSADTGGGGAHNNMPPYCTVYFLIKT